MDITEALAPTSDQLDAIELIEPRTFTIAPGSALGQREGKTVAEIRLVDFPRVWRPSKGMLDVLGACWGKDGSQWAGRRVTVYNDREVMFGRVKTGGVRISHLSHIGGPRTLTIRASGAGKTQQWHVEPLTDAPMSTEPSAEQVAACADVDALKALYDAAKSPEMRALIRARKAELIARPAPTLDNPLDHSGDNLGDGAM